MKHYKQFHPLLISEFETAKWTHPEHNHNHHELIYILQGQGVHTINGNHIDYKKGDIFLVGPDEEHFFEVEVVTKFVFVKFTDVYIHQTNSGSTYGVQELEYLIKSRETHFSGFNLSKEDRQTAKGIMDVILSLKHDIFLNERLIWLQVLALAVLLQRNMPELKTSPARTRDMQAVFCYLHKYVYTPSKLRAPIIAANFNTTAEYIGPYFKRNTGMTLRDYISAYRKTLIKQRLESGNYNLKLIANEFGLTDESHVRKILLS